MLYFLLGLPVTPFKGKGFNEDDYGTTTNDNNNRKPMKEYDSSKLTIHTPSKKKKNQEKKC